MSSREALRSGDVHAALSLLKEEVRKAPRDPRLRVFLFQMFCITGEWERALAQLSLAGELDPQADAMVQTYRVLIACEGSRDDIFNGRRPPEILGEPAAWLPMLVEAVRLLGAGDAARAAALRDEAFDLAPASPVILGGEPAEWVADADPRLGPVFEAVIDGRYVWVPYTAVASLALEPPADLRDQVWMPARFTWAHAGTAIGFIPTRYPGTTARSDPALLLARRTEWLEQGDWSIPIGQRTLVTDGADVALMDLRHLSFDSAERPA